jgi:hypothetical protein
VIRIFTYTRQKFIVSMLLYNYWKETKTLAAQVLRGQVKMIGKSSKFLAHRTDSLNGKAEDGEAGS